MSGNTISRASLTLYNDRDEIIQTGEIDFATFEETRREGAVTEKDAVAFLYAILLEQMAEGEASDD